MKFRKSDLNRNFKKRSSILMSPKISLRQHRFDVRCGSPAALLDDFSLMSASGGKADLYDPNLTNPPSFSVG